MTKPKIIFMGTPEFANVSLLGLIESGAYEILAVVTQPDRKVGRKQEVRETPVKKTAREHGIPVYQPERLSTSDELHALLALNPEGIVTAAFGQFLPSVLLTSVKFSVNVHASLLPKYRGGAPIHYALINGDEKTGVTLMEMTKEMDAGDMIAQAEIPIDARDNVGTLFDKLALLGRDLLLSKLPLYLSGQITSKPQDLTQVSFSPNISAEQEKIDWQQSARQIFNQIRGMAPFPVAYTTLSGQRFKIYQAHLSEEAPSNLTGEPGQIVAVTKKSLEVATGQGLLALEKVQPAGKPVMSIRDFLNGQGKILKKGDQFGN